MNLPRAKFSVYQTPQDKSRGIAWVWNGTAFIKTYVFSEAAIRRLQSA